METCLACMASEYYFDNLDAAIEELAGMIKKPGMSNEQIEFMGEPMEGITEAVANVQTALTYHFRRI